MTEEIVIATSLIAGVTVIGILYALAASLRDRSAIHDLHVEVVEIRNEYLREIISRDEYTTVEILPDGSG